MTPTKRQLELMEHALAARHRNSPFFRNWFVADPGSEDDREWETLVTIGCAYVYQEPDDWSPYRIYAVTGSGRDIVRQNLGDIK